jgi:soluble lytic murein transglycosylase-like protein
VTANRNTILWLLLGGTAFLYLITQRKSLYSVASNAGDFIMASIAGWKNVGQGAKWAPILDSIGASYRLPPDLLARVAYQESHFRDDIIRGTTPSSAGARGIMQMMPQFFSSVNVSRPYTDDAVRSQIVEAAAHLSQLYASLKSWPLTLAAYNAGQGTVQQYGGIPPFPETQAYVAQIRADVPNLV